MNTYAQHSPSPHCSRSCLHTPIDGRNRKTAAAGPGTRSRAGHARPMPQDGFRVSVTVLNNAGQPIVLLRDGGTGPHTATPAGARLILTHVPRADHRIVKTPGRNPALANLNNVTTCWC